MKFKVQIHSTAIEDIESAAGWIAEKYCPDKAIEWTSAIFDQIDTLDSMPDRCGLAPEDGKWGPEKLQQLLFQEYPSTYRILFHVIDDVVHVLQVRHGAMRWMHEEEPCEK